MNGLLGLGLDRIENIPLGDNGGIDPLLLNGDFSLAY